MSIIYSNLHSFPVHLTDQVVDRIYDITATRAVSVWHREGRFYLVRYGTRMYRTLDNNPNFTIVGIYTAAVGYDQLKADLEIARNELGQEDTI